MSRSLVTLLLCASTVLVAGCDQLGIETATTIAAKKEADGKAVGGACRHAGRAIEDCYTLNKKADRPAVYAGWREMNEYMRENKIEPVIPVIKPEPPVAAKPAANPDEADEAVEPAPKKVAASKH
jgi:hypothetical protein